MTLIDFQKKMRDLMATRALTQDNVAHRLGVRRKTVEAWLANPDAAWARCPNRFERIGIIHELINSDLQSSRMDWSGVDWALRTSVIAEMLGVTSVDVSAARRRHAPDTLRAFDTSKGLRATEWHGVDWSKSNKTLAREIGVSLETVRVNRIKYAAETYTGRTLANCATDWSRMNWSRSNADISGELGITVQSVRRQRRKHMGD